MPTTRFSLLVHGGLLTSIILTFNTYVLSFYTQELFDFEIYRTALESYIQNKSLYGTAVAPTDFIYPPTFVRLFSMLLYIESQPMQAFFWQCVNFLCLWGGGLLCIHCFFQVNQRAAGKLLLALVLLCSPPAYAAFKVGQVNCVVFLMLALFFYCLKARHTIGAGAVLAMATFLKFTPILLIGALFCFKNFRIILSAGLFFVLSLLLDSRILKDWFEFIVFLPEWLAHTDLLVHPANLASAWHESLFGRILVILAICFVLLKKIHSFSKKGLTPFCLGFLILPFLFTPILWIHHFVLFYPALLYAVGAFLNDPKNKSSAQYILLLSASALFLLPLFWIYYSAIYRELIFITMLLLFISCMICAGTEQSGLE